LNDTLNTHHQVLFLLDKKLDSIREKKEGALERDTTPKRIEKNPRRRKKSTRRRGLSRSSSSSSSSSDSWEDVQVVCVVVVVVVVQIFCVIESPY